MNRNILESIVIHPSTYRKWGIEKDFQRDIFKSLNKLWWITYHPADVWLNTKFLDWITVTPLGETVFIEFKKIQWYTFNFSQFEPTQIKLFSQFLSRPKVEAYIMIFSIATWQYKVCTYKELLEVRDEKDWCKLFAHGNRIWNKESNAWGTWTKRNSVNNISKEKRNKRNSSTKTFDSDITIPF